MSPLRVPVASLLVLSSFAAGQAPEAEPLRLATFAVDATPPIGSPLCDALVPNARRIVDRLSARGVVLLGAGEPIVLFAVDWVGIGNGGHDAWRAALAEAAATTAARVCVHTLHQHDAPGCDFEAEALLAEHGLSGRMFAVEFARETIARAAQALREALREPRRVTHVGRGRARVEKVASNRRILGPDGKVRHVRFSKCRDPEAVAAPEGVIDPWLRCVSLFDGDEPLVVLTYYATHPQSYYGAGGVSADFVGLARAACEAETPGVRWIHFNGAGGNVAAGKYNDGSPQRRPVLAERLATGMRAARAAIERRELSAADVTLATTGVALPAAAHLDEAELLARLRSSDLGARERVRAARDLVWLRRARGGHEIDLSCLRLGPDIRIVHLPGELFVEYQLAAQRMDRDALVCVAAYGDYGPGYIGTEIAYGQGGYETGRVSRVAPAVEPVLLGGIRELLEGAAPRRERRR